MSDEVEQGHSVAEAGGSYVATAEHNTHAPARIPGRNGGTLTPIRSSERGRAMVQRRWEKKAEAVRQGMRDAAGLLTDKAGLTLPGGAPIVTEYDVIRVLSTSQALNAADPSSPGGNQSYQRLLDNGFPKPERDPAAAAAVPAGGATLALSPELAQQLLSAMRERRQQGE